MKASNFLFMLILTTLLASCGSKESSVSLKVSGTMAISAGGFGGGVSVTGVGPENKTFTINAVGDNTVQVNLADGAWKFYAVTWNGGNVFTGDIACGYLETTLSSSNTTISITADIDTCNSGRFTNIPDMTDADTGFQNLQIMSCSSHYFSGGTPVSSSIASLSSYMTSFCDQANQPLDMKEKPGSIKITLPGKGPEGETLTALNSECITYGTNYVDTDMLIPVGKIPFKFSLYRDSSCNDLAQIHEFPNGIQEGAVKDGIVLHAADASSNALFLPYTISKSGFSPMMDKLPWISCSTGSFCPFPTVVSWSPDYVLLFNQGGHNPGVVISREPGAKCEDFTFSSFNNLIDEGCEEDEEDGVFLRVRPAPEVNCESSGDCTFTVNGNLKHVYTDNTPGFQIWNSVARHLGGQPDSYFLSSMDAFKRAPYSYGELDDIRVDLGPDGPLGVYGNTPCMSLPTDPKIISVFEEGQLKIAQIIAKNSTMPIPLEFCEDSDPHATACTNGTTFDKQIIVRMLINSNYVTTMSMHLSCSRPLGMMERYHFDDHDDEQEYRDEQSIVYWNTADEAKARIEKYQREVSYEDPARTLSYETNNRFVHVGRGSSDYYIYSLNYHSRKTGPEVEEHLNREEIGVSFTPEAQQIRMDMSLTRGPAATQDIFSLPHLASQRATKPFIDKIKNSSDPGSEWGQPVNYSDAGGYMAYVVGPISTIKVRPINSSNTLSIMDTNDETESYTPRLHQLPGRLHLAYLRPDSGTLDIRLRTYNIGSGTASSPITLTTVPSLDSLAIAGRSGYPDIVDVMWTEGTKIKFIQKDETNAGDSGAGSIDQGYFIVPNSLKVKNLPGNPDKHLVVWMEQSGSDYLVKSATYNASEPIQGSRFSAIQTLSGQPNIDIYPTDFSLTQIGTQLVYGWSTFEMSVDVFHQAKTPSMPSTAELTYESTNISNLRGGTHVNCVNAANFQDIGACTGPLYPTETFQPVKPGFNSNLQSLNPSTFNGLFTPISTFRNIK